MDARQRIWEARSWEAEEGAQEGVVVRGKIFSRLELEIRAGDQIATAVLAIAISGQALLRIGFC